MSKYATVSVYCLTVLGYVFKTRWAPRGGLLDLFFFFCFLDPFLNKKKPCKLANTFPTNFPQIMDLIKLRTTKQYICDHFSCFNTRKVLVSLAIKAGCHWQRSLSRSRSRKSASDLVKIENRSRKRSHKLDGIGVGRIRTVPFSSYSDAYDPVKTRLSESQAEAEAQEPTNHNAGFILRLPLTTI